MLTKEERDKRANEMRAEPTKHEKMFRDRLNELKIKFRSQKCIGHYIVDFVIGKVIIEIDGNTHCLDEAKEYDERRTIRLNGYGYKVARVWNSDVKTVDIFQLLDNAGFGIKKDKKKKNKPDPNRIKKGSQKRNTYIEALLSGQDEKLALRNYRDKKLNKRSEWQYREMNQRFDNLISKE